MTTEFSELYEQFAGHVLAYARRHTNRDDAEDVVAETFHVAWRRRDVVPDEALPWLLGVAHNVLRSQWRTARRTTPADTLERLADVAGDSQEVGASDAWSLSSFSRSSLITNARPSSWSPGTT